MKDLAVLYWVFIFCVLAEPGVSAHSGNSDEKALLGLEDMASEIQEETSPYAIGRDENLEAYLGLSRDGLTDEAEMELTMGKMTHDSGKHESGHGEHQMPKIKMPEHDWVATSQKGYGVALGITLLAGAVFGVMNFKRSP